MGITVEPGDRVAIMCNGRVCAADKVARLTKQHILLDRSDFKFRISDSRRAGKLERYDPHYTIEPLTTEHIAELRRRKHLRLLNRIDWGLMDNGFLAQVVSFYEAELKRKETECGTDSSSKTTR